MAAVYRVRHTQLGSIHALKVLSAGTKAVRERLMQEGKVQASLRHPNVVAVTDVIDVSGDPGLVMEYVAGPPLDKMLKEQRPNLPEAVRIFMGVVRGVRHAHGKGLIHRDLKPGNVLLEETEDGLVPKVADFGLVKVVENAGGTGTTKSGVAMGTPEYMAPEQIRDAANVDKRADMFSLGCIFYELVCGAPPFKGGDMLQVFNKVATGNFRDPAELVPDIPESVRAGILGLLEVDVEKRIQDCDALLDLLQSDSGTSGQWSVNTTPAWAPTDGSLSPPTPRSPAPSPTSWNAGQSQPSLSSMGDTLPEDAPPQAGILPFLALPVIAISLAAIVAVFAGPANPVSPPIDLPTEVPDTPPPPLDPPGDDAQGTGAESEPTQGPDASGEDGADASPQVAPGDEGVGDAPDPPQDGANDAAAQPVEPTPPPVRTNPPPRETRPPPPADTPATVDWKGDARNVWLVAGDKRYPARGSVPPGSYDILAWFDQPEPANAGRLTVAPGQEVMLNCVGFLHKCK